MLIPMTSTEAVALAKAKLGPCAVVGRIYTWDSKDYKKPRYFVGVDPGAAEPSPTAAARIAGGRSAFRGSWKAALARVGITAP